VNRRSYQIEKADVPSNFLYLQMVEIIKQIKPKMFLFENVFGLTFSRWTSQGRKGEIWAEIQEAFQALPDYVVPRGTVIHASKYGVPQNRPRVMIVGIRRDCRGLLGPRREAPADGLLPEPGLGVRAPHLKDVLDDLIDPDYLQKGVTVQYPNAPRTKIQRWFREKPDGTIGRKGDMLMDQEYSRHREQTRKKFLYMIRHDGRIPDHLKTRKFALRVLPSEWDERGPVVTVTSLPDDFVHFAQPRIPTVREWARMQTFPDWYQFRGSRTTGGMCRAGNPAIGDWHRDAPRYTQIGNAVPVKLAFAIGQHFAKILENRSDKPATAA
jgi:DNA (cytosine-5)-methyltransferase 1